MKHAVYEHQLPGGAKGLVIKVPGSGVVAASAIFNSGFAFGDPAKYELPHVMEHLMGSGTKSYPTAVAFKTEAEKNGAYRNASTSVYFNTYDYECAAFEAERIIRLLGSQVSEPLFPAKSFPTELSNVREELASNTSSYERLSYIYLLKALMPGQIEDYDTRIAQLPDISTADIKAYYDRTHRRGNLRFYITGEVEGKGERLVAALGEAMADLAEGPRLEFPEPVIQKLAEPILVRRPIQQIYYYIENHFTEVSYRRRLAGRLLGALLTGGYRSWLLGEARERGLAYHVGAGFSLDPRAANFAIGAFVTKDNAEELFKLIARSLNRAKEGDFTDQDVEEAADLTIGRIMRSHQTATDMMGWYAGNYAYSDEVLDFDQYNRDLRSVTKAEIVELAVYIAEQGTWGMGLVGDITKTYAKKLHDLVKTAWYN